MHAVLQSSACLNPCCSFTGRCQKLCGASRRKVVTNSSPTGGFHRLSCFLHQDQQVSSIKSHLSGATSFDCSSASSLNDVLHEDKPQLHNLQRQFSFSELYELGQELGRGCFAVAYAVRERATGHTFCAKKIPKQRLRYSLTYCIAAIEQEVSILRQLQHCKHIVQIFDVVETEGHVYIITEACLGGTLAEYLQDSGPLSEMQCAYAMHSILSAIQACHSAGIEYGDLKPTNVLLRKKPTSPNAPLDLALADFGCSQFVDKCGRAHSSPGTPLFAAPEVMYKRNGLEADLWSAGVLMYHMLSCHWPFHNLEENLSSGAVMRRVLSAPILWSSAQWASISDGAVRLVQQMLQREKSSRITATEALQHPWIKDKTWIHHAEALQ